MGSSTASPHPVGFGLIAAVDGLVPVVQSNHLKSQKQNGSEDESQESVQEPVLNQNWTGSTHDPAEAARGLFFGHQLALVGTKNCPLWEDFISAANVYLLSLREDLQARRDGERRPVGRSRSHRCVRDEERGPVGRTLLLEIVLTVLTDWKTNTVL